MLEHTSTSKTLYLLDSFCTSLIYSLSPPNRAVPRPVFSIVPILASPRLPLLHRPEEVALNAVHRRSPLGEPARLLKSYGCGQTKKVFRRAGLHTVQLAFCCLPGGFDGFAVLRIGDHAH